MNSSFAAAALLIISCLPKVVAQSPSSSLPVEIKLLPAERWWGGLSIDGPAMPYGSAAPFARNLDGDNGQNQSQPLLVSSRGRYVWSEKPFRFEFTENILRLTAAGGEVIQGRAGETLHEGFREAAQRFFPADGRTPDPLMFSRPQYNTWIELGYEQTEESILRYARAAKQQGYPPGVLMIDDNWQEDYGDWRFSGRRFPNPKAMVAELHALGFKVMLWVCPFVSPDCETFRELEAKGFLLRDVTPQAVHDAKFWSANPPAATVRWWNGLSACLDFSNPGAVAWFKARLDALVQDYGVDGFKFDAGDFIFYRGRIASHVPTLANEHAELYAQFGLHYPLNEYRAAWKMAGRPLAQRLVDKAHLWEDLQALIPDIIAQGLMGYAFTCPDMAGGGLRSSFLGGAAIDQELMVRSTQVHALMPMMQFSAAPWRILDAEHNAICLSMAELHVQHAETILALTRHAAKTGEPIVRPLCWQWPERDYEGIKDQFMLGDGLLVAPVVTKGARSRVVEFPPGRWLGDDGSTVDGPCRRTISAPLERLPFYRLQP